MVIFKLNWVTRNCKLLNEKPIQLHQWHKMSDSFSATLLYNETSSIWQQLSEKLLNKPIKEIKVFSPFYDEKGTFLKQLNTSFPQSKIQVFLQPNKGIHPFKMEALENVKYFSWESTDRVKNGSTTIDRKLHSKILWFDCDEEQYAMFGSPNATIKAFGTATSRGANDEFAVLLKVPNQNILKALQLTGNYKEWKPQQIDLNIEIEAELEKEQSKNIRKIKLLGVDQDHKQLKIYIRKTTHYKDAVMACYNSWGEELARKTLKVSATKIVHQLESNSNSIAYVQFLDKNENIISNKQIVNKLHELWNTNPSEDNRKLMKLSSLIESGNSKLFDVINFFNDIQASKSSSQSKSVGSSNKDKKVEENTHNSISYEDAVELSNGLKENQQILSKHNTIQIWDAIERYFNHLSASEEEEDMDDEEGGEVITSREREDKKTRTYPISLNSEKVLKTRRRAFDKFLTNYSSVLDNNLSKKEHKISQIDMAMFLIVIKHLIEYTEREVIFKVSKDKEDKQILFPVSGNLSELTSFSGAILNIVGRFVNLINKSPFLVVEDEYLTKKQEHYKLIVKRTVLFSLAIIKQIYRFHEKGSNWADILAYNIIDVFGNIDKETTGFLDEFLKNSSMSNLKSEELLSHLQNWELEFKRLSDMETIFAAKNLGLCTIYKRIPNTGKTKYLKLSRPGFNYQENENEFILEELYNIESHELVKSLKSIK